MTAKKPLTSADVRAKHKEFLFPSCANYYEEPIVARERQGARGSRTSTATSTSTSSAASSRSSSATRNEAVNARGPRADRPARARLDALPDPADRRARREARERSRPGKLKKAFFTASGTEADETAVAARAGRTRARQELIALRHGYSGRSLLAQSLTAHAKLPRHPDAGRRHQARARALLLPLPLRPEYPSCDVKCAKDIEELIQTTTTGQIAGFLAEPIMGVGGFITPPDGYFKVAVDIVRKYGGVFICDEVQTGFGRTGGKMWGIEHHEGVEPDIMTMAKGIANGYPSAPTLATARHRRRVEGRQHLHLRRQPDLVRPRPTRRSSRSSTTSSPRTPRRWARCCARGSRRSRRSTRRSSATCAARA